MLKKRWWHEKNAYQIYPKSFCDSNGDGIGDLNGIRQHLDDLKDLGVDIIWISPCYKSPMVDQGYDISDYYDIDPIFGSMEDMDCLLAEAKEKDLSILMDLVLNHCSDKHQWFQKACQDPYGEYGKYFYIAEGKINPETGKSIPPCNWRAYFGGSVWTPLPKLPAGAPDQTSFKLPAGAPDQTSSKLPANELGKDSNNTSDNEAEVSGQSKTGDTWDNLYYLHMFAKEQPDLNWENPLVREELYKMIRWWRQKGVAGFRLDAIINIKKDLEFRDVEIDGADGMGGCWKMLDNATGVIDFLKELKEKAFAEFEYVDEKTGESVTVQEAFTVAELSDYNPEEFKEYCGDDGVFETIFDFSVFAAQRGKDMESLTPEELKKVIFTEKARTQNLGMMANVIENHDELRGVNRLLPEDVIYDDRFVDSGNPVESIDAVDTTSPVQSGESLSRHAKKAVAVLNIMPFGLPFLYQGQEIGMTNIETNSICEIDDIMWKGMYEKYLEDGMEEKKAFDIVARFNRDNARTPVQWDGSLNAGFTSGKPWLRVNPNYKDINVQDQQKDEKSLRAFYKKLLNLRKNPELKEALVWGQMKPYKQEQENLIAFFRANVLVLVNFCKEANEVELPAGDFEEVLRNSSKIEYLEDQETEKLSVLLQGYDALILKYENEKPIDTRKSK